MPPFNHSVTTRAWRVVTPNTPFSGEDASAASVPLQFLSLPHLSARSSQAVHPSGSEEAALLQSAGPIFVEIPCAKDLGNQPQLLSFTALRHA
jgi:hypothetical protein